MWRLVFLRTLYYLFFFAVFAIALLIFLRLVDFYFYIPAFERFLLNFVSRINV